MKSKEKEVMMSVMMLTVVATMMTFKMTVVMMAMMITKHDSYERNASLQNAPELILARCKDVLWHRAQCKGVLLCSAQCKIFCAECTAHRCTEYSLCIMCTHCAMHPLYSANYSL